MKVTVFSWNTIPSTQRETVDELRPLEEEIVIVVSDHHEDIEDTDLVCADLVAGARAVKCCLLSFVSQ